MEELGSGRGYARRWARAARGLAGRWARRGARDLAEAAASGSFRSLSGSFRAAGGGGAGADSGGEEEVPGPLPRDSMTPFQRRRARARWRLASRIAGMQRRQQLLDQALLEKRMVEAIVFVGHCVEGVATSGEAILLPARAAFGLHPSLGWDVMQESIYLWDALSRRWTLETVSPKDFNPALDRSLVHFKFREAQGGFLTLAFAVDCASCIPHALLRAGLGLLQLGEAHAAYQFLSALGMLKVLRLGPAWVILRRGLAGLDQWLRALLGQNHSPGLLRLMQLLLVTLYLTHTIGLLYITVLRYEGFPSSPFAIPVACPHAPGEECSYFEAHRADPWRCYLRSLFWAFESITGGNSYDPDSPLEVLVSAGVVAASMAMNVALFGSIASLIAQWDERRAAFRLKLEAVEDFAERTAIAPQLVARIKRYYELVWERHNGVEDDLRVLEDLPRQLRTEVLESLYADKIRGVDIFRHAEQAFILSLATKLSNLVVPEGEWVVRKGEVGQEMFFIVRGECEVVLEGNKVVANLSRGSYFGEIALLLAERRTASIRTKKDCELLKLQKEDFEELLNLFPKTRELFYQIAQQRSKQRGVEDPEDALLAELPLVKRCPLFQHCEAEVARAVVFSLRPVEFARGDSVAVAGDAAHEMYFCSSGRLKVMPVEDASEGPSRGSWQKSVRILKEGDFFGQEALLEPGARCHASIVALEQATLMKLSRAAFMSVCSRFPDFAVRPGRPLDFSPSSPSRGPGQVRWNRLSPVLATVQKALSPHKKEKTG